MAAAYHWVNAARLGVPKWAGRNQAVGAELKGVGEEILGAESRSQAAMLLSYDTRFAFQGQPNHSGFRYPELFAGYYAARDKGFYAAAGLDVKFLEGGPGKSCYSIMMSGQARRRPWDATKRLFTNYTNDNYALYAA